MKRPQYSIAALLFLIATCAIGVALYRHFNQPPLHPVPTLPIGGYWFHGNIYGKPFTGELTSAQIAATPTWDRRNTNPPVSASRALVLADKHRERMIEHGVLPASTEFERWVLGSVRLVPYNEQDGKWFWLVQYYIHMDQSGPLNEIEFVILMDGTVLKPEVVPH